MKNDLKNKQPLVSIVMPVYNAGKFLRTSLESILNQTYTNWELVAVDDGSQDNSLAILKEYANQDKRIRIYKQPRNLGVSKTANSALKQVHGTLIARMDADDVMKPERIAKQVLFLQKNPDVVTVGGQCQLIDENGKVIGNKSFPLDNQAIYKMMYQAMPVQQPTLMINKKLLPDNFIWYEKEFTTAEEVDLLFRLFQYGKIANLPDVILEYRIHQNNVSLINPKKTFFLTYQTRKEAVIKYHYQPTLKAEIVNFMQWLTISLIPAKAIYPLFIVWRGLKPLKEMLPRIKKYQISFTEFTISRLPEIWRVMNQSVAVFLFILIK